MSKSRARRRAEARRGGSDEGGARTNRIYLVLAGVALLALGSLAYSFFAGMGTGATAPVELEGMDDPEELVEFASGVELGDPDAPATIVEFADYQCPACQQFATRVLPTVKSELVDTGLARIVFYDFPLVGAHQHAFLAARAARCAGDQDRYWDYHDELFRNQSEWSSTGNPGRLFSGYAADLGLDRDAFDACLRSDRYADVVTANQMLGRQVGVSGTPTVLVSDGEGAATRIQNWNYENIREAVEAEVEG